MKYTGRETPASAVNMVARSSRLPLRRADTMPVPTPKTAQMIAAPAARPAVTGSAFTSVGHTGSLFSVDRPKQGAGHQVWSLPAL